MALTKSGVLFKYFGHSAFRPGQEALIDALLRGNDALGILPTGGGKSICYQVPALLKEHITLVISPLVSLMQDQVMALNQMGVRAAYINASLSPGQIREALNRAARYTYKIIYVAPERLLTASFLAFASQVDISMVAVDEAHCVSQWGQDFRPAYLNIPVFLDKLPQRPPVGAFTATATPQVRRDILTLLKLKDPHIEILGFDRPNLYFEVRTPKDKTQEVLGILQDKQGKTGIIYCATRKNVDALCDALRYHGYAAERYHAGMSDADRKLAQEQFQFDRVKIMVATNAFGMGIDKSNVQFVIHYNMPKDLESYYQEAGRAGRDGEKADCILLYAKRDVFVAQYLIEKQREDRALDEQQAAALKEKELERLKHMTYYATGTRCLRRRILAYFGENLSEDCHNCSCCLGVRPLKTVKTAPKAAPQGLELRFQALRLLRNEWALHFGLPAYVIFPDATLRDMADKMPTDEKAFLGVSGVGEEKSRRYGKAFVALIRQMKIKEGEGLFTTPHDASMLAKFAFQAHRPWTKEEELRLWAAAAQGQSVYSLAQLLHRTEEEVQLKLSERS